MTSSRIALCHWTHGRGAYHEDLQRVCNCPVLLSGRYNIHGRFILADDSMVTVRHCKFICMYVVRRQDDKTV